MKPLPIEQLQQDVLDFLHSVSSFVTHIGNILDSRDMKNGKYADLKIRLDSAIETIRHLQLRMVVVAPMKAGKSTIINAIAGQELLPSRNTAMTALPTEITFDQGIQEPCLELSDALLTLFEDIFEILRTRLQEIEKNNETIEELEQMEYLKTLAEQIRTGQYAFPSQPRTAGKDSICNTLERMNDLIRLYGIVAPDSTIDVFEQFETIPHIHAPLLHSKNAETSEKLGNLVVIDTPGENESVNLNLSGVVQAQLERSSIVLLVLDFTQLNNQAAEQIRQKVQRLIDIREKEHLYILVNKIDQRDDEKDMDSKGVRQFVGVQFGVTADEEHVFEVSAKQAFCATNFLLEVREAPKLNVSEMKTSRSLAKEVLGAKWERRLAQSTCEELSEEAGDLWNSSGFKTFLEKAIHTLMLQVAPKCLKSELVSARNSLVLLLNDLAMRKNALAIEQEKIQEQLQDIEKDLKELQGLQKPWEIDIITYKDELQGRLRKQIRIAKKQATIRFENLENIDKFTEFFQSLCREFAADLKSELFQFSQKTHAQNFSARILQYFEQHIQEVVKDLRKMTMREIQVTNHKIRQDFSKKTGEMIKQAEERLNKTFHINIKLSMPEWQVSANDVEDIVVLKRQNESRWGWVRLYMGISIPWLFKYEKKAYTVSLNNIYTKVNASVDANFDNIESSLRTYLDQDFERRMREFFDSVQNYFETYRNTLERALNDHKLEGEKKEQLVNDLNESIPQIETYIQKAETHLGNVSEIMRQQNGK